MRLHLTKRFCIVPVHLICRRFGNLLFVLSFRNNSFCLYITFRHIQIVDCGTVIRVLTDALCKNIFCSGKRIFRTLNVKRSIFIISLDEFLCLFPDCLVVKFKHCICKRIKSFFYSDHTARLLLFLERCPQIFKLRKRRSRHCRSVKAFSKFSLLKNALYNLKTALFKIFICFEKMVAVTNLHFIQIIVLFLAVTADERNGTPFINKTDDRTYLLNANLQFVSNFLHNINFIDL